MSHQRPDGRLNHCDSLPEFLLLLLWQEKIIQIRHLVLLLIVAFPVCTGLIASAANDSGHLIAGDPLGYLMRIDVVDGGISFNVVTADCTAYSV